MTKKKAYLSDKQIKELLKNRDNPENIEKIAKSLEKVVYKIAHSYKSDKVTFNDLQQAGFEGLMKAIWKFDPQYKNKFSSYAYQCIRGYILNELNATHKKNNYIMFSDMKCGSSEDSDNLDYQDTISSTYNTDIDVKNNSDISNMLTVLKDNEKKCVIHYFGLYNNKPMTLEQIGHNIMDNYTPAGIKAIVDRSIEKLKGYTNFVMT